MVVVAGIIRALLLVRCLRLLQQADIMATSFAANAPALQPIARLVLGIIPGSERCVTASILLANATIPASVPVLMDV